MGEYGVTPKGFVLKRLDTIIDEINNDLIAGWGFDPAVNPQSFVGVLIATFANQIAQAWEAGQETYYAMYPSSAEGVNLDNALQFGGIFREPDERTLYYLACAGVDGTEIPYGSVVESKIPPIKSFRCTAAQKITSQGFRTVVIGVLSVEANSTYTVSINSSTYSYTSDDSPTEVVIIKGLSEQIMQNTAQFEVSIDEENMLMTVNDVNKNSTNAVTLSNNLVVSQVVSNLSFESLEYGDISIPFGTLTNIVSTISGWESVTNDIAPIPGRFRQADYEARLSYYERLAHRSTSMLESITSALYNNVPGIISVTGYENDTDEIDENGLAPHSIWIVVDGGDPGQIAQTIFAKKAAGINTNGSVGISVPDAYGNLIPIRFSRPTPQYVWLSVTLTRDPNVALPANYEQLTKDVIMSLSEKLKPGQTIQFQKMYGDIYNAVPGLSLIDIKGTVTDETTPNPPQPYTQVNIPITRAQKAIFDPNRIEVVLVD